MNFDLITKTAQLSGHTILCVGDVMLDRFIYGQVERVSPEAPIPVLHMQRELVSPGGVGNVVRNISTLGSKPELIAVVGQDEIGRELLASLDLLSHTVPNLVTDKSRHTTLKVRYVAGSQQLLRADQESTGALSAEIEDKIIATATAAMDRASVVILSDYAKGVLSLRVLSAIIEMAKKKSLPVLIDPKGRDYNRYNGASYLTPNRKELSDYAGHAVKTVQDAEDVARQMIAKHNLKGVLAKLGSGGICLVERDRSAVLLPAIAKEVFDVSGAGDTVIATFASGLAAGMSPSDAAALANVAGSVVVGKVGTAAVTAPEIAAAIADHIMHETTPANSIIGHDKVVTRDAAHKIATLWQQRGYKVGFTNGCFDLLHPGHLSLLNQSRSACDKLVLGLNTDASVKRLKGETRPVQNEAARAAVLAALGCVDLVVLFDEDTPLELIKAVHPDVLVKGADYTIDKVVGADLVMGWGGKVVLANLVEGQSTTKTISRLKAV